MKDGFKLKGTLRIEKKSPGTDWELVTTTNNLVVDVGKEFVIDKISSSETAYLTHFGVGSSLVGVSLADTELGYKDDITSDSEPHKAFTSVVDSGTKVTFRLDLNSAEPSVQPAQLSEVGLFTAVSGGTMFSRVVHVPVTKTTSDEIRYYYDVRVE